MSNIKAINFDSIALSIASPDAIHEWSHGEVTKPETINYRTQKPERDGLFCEKIFGPTKNWECYCGKYKRIRYKGVVCEKCGVEVTHSSVRRQRMGHIDLAVPITHTWFVRSTPSRIGLLLDLSVKQIEQIIYFASYLVSDVDSAARDEALKELDKEFKQHKNRIIGEYEELVEGAKNEMAKESAEKKKEKVERIRMDQADEIEELTRQHEKAKRELSDLKAGNILSELEYRELSMKFGQVFQAGTGAETIRNLLVRIDLEKFIAEAEEEMHTCSEQRSKKLLKKIQLARSLFRSTMRPEWMVLTVLPVIPPDLRPMVQLDGGRFAASDLNDLYRRVINRNNRLRKLMEIGAPEVICRNEKRMLQEAVDTLLNNSPRSGKAILTTGDRRKLRSLSDMLKGKQGRFRQNLLGKRVDYSGRSVIVVGPNLKMNQCGLPKEMALKLFKPFVIGKLISRGMAHNVKNAEKIIQTGVKEVWDELEDVIKGRYVMLNRAPTLHRLGIQAFQPVLIEGKAIQIHPLVCEAFNADFDGDQMAVHVPLSDAAQKEARELIASARNLLKPSAGEPVVNPLQDMILGAFYLTYEEADRKGTGRVFESFDAVLLAHECGELSPQAKIKAMDENGVIHDTTAGRIIFHTAVTKPVGLPFENKAMRKGELKELLATCLNEKGDEAAVFISDAIKNLGYKFATLSGLSISQDDVVIPSEKTAIIAKADEIATHIQTEWWKGRLTDDERYMENIKLWSDVKKEIADLLKNNYPKNNIFYMVQSGARGNWGQVTQLAGIKGLVADPSGKTIELPIKSSLKEGFSVLEYFSATHGGRKGKSDTALKTAEAGYLTRRLVDSTQDIIIREDDCGQTDIHWVTVADSERIGESFYTRIFGRTLAAELKDENGKVLGKRGQIIDKDLLTIIKKTKIDKAPIRSTLSCNTKNGICKACYGNDLGKNKVVETGTPVGIIAAQSIGEPGTQLTMRTFHMGGVAGEGDITQGLERVEEIFEARPPKTPAILSDISGEVKVKKHGNTATITVIGTEPVEKTYTILDSQNMNVAKGDVVKDRQILATGTEGAGNIRAEFAGKILKAEHGEITIKELENSVREYEVSAKQSLLVKNGETVTKGQALTSGHYHLRDYMELAGIYAAQKYVLQEVQTVYASQGQTINDKHLEIIVREMFSNGRIVDPGDSPFLPGEIITHLNIEELNRELVAKGQKIVRYERMLLGLTRAALKTDSWLSAASFQETVRVLVDAATTKRVDNLMGLKENVIIGRLIPAGEQYRRILAGKGDVREEDELNETAATAKQE